MPGPVGIITTRIVQMRKLKIPRGFELGHTAMSTVMDQYHGPVREGEKAWS